MCPAPSGLINPHGHLVCHCLLIESEAGLVLVETGYGMQDIAAPSRRLGLAVLYGSRPILDPNETAVAQIEALGFAAEDVRHIVCTHLDVDHAGGVSDFPKATVHVHKLEQKAALNGTFQDRQRYRLSKWDQTPAFATYSEAGEPWFGFDAVRQLDGLPPEILLIPLYGHSPGHCAIAVDAGERWLLHCGDAYFFEGEVDPAGRRSTRGLDAFQWLTQVDGKERIRNQRRLRELNRDHGDQIDVFCAHDPTEFEALAQRSQRATTG